jgi:hypothetical protein
MKCTIVDLSSKLTSRNKVIKDIFYFKFPFLERKKRHLTQGYSQVQVKEDLSTDYSNTVVSTHAHILKPRSQPSSVPSGQAGGLTVPLTGCSHSSY